MATNYFCDLPNEIIEHIVKQNDETLEDKINKLVPSLKFAENLVLLNEMVKNVNEKIQKEFRDKFKKNDIIRLRREIQSDFPYYEYFIVYQFKKDTMRAKLLTSCEERGMFEYFEVVGDTLNIIHITECDKYEMYSSYESRKLERIKIANKLVAGDKAEIQVFPNGNITNDMHYHGNMNQLYLTTATITKVTNKFVHFDSATRNMDHRDNFNYCGYVLKENVMYKYK